jgi:hypothetical protein
MTRQKKIGPAIAASYGATFTGDWRTIAGSEMSTIDIEYSF